MQGTGTSDTRPQRARQRLLQAVAWAALVALLWGVDLVTQLNALGPGEGPRRMVSEQVTSGLAALVMVLFVERWLVLFPITRERWPAAVVGHTVGTMFFAFGHYGLMVALRWLWFSATDQVYVWREPFLDNLFVEYQKDIKIYLGMLAVIVAYQRIFSVPAQTTSTAVEARTVPTGASPSPVEEERILVQTGSGTEYVAVAAIEYLATSRNYVCVHVDGREYLLRDTLTAVLERLPAEQFLRVHRQYAVNRHYIDAARGAGPAALRLRGGAEVPVSRSYRALLAEKLVKS